MNDKILLRVHLEKSGEIYHKWIDAENLQAEVDFINNELKKEGQPTVILCDVNGKRIIPS